MLNSKKFLSVFVTLVMTISLVMTTPIVTIAATNIALNKTATASSSQNSTNTPDKAFDGNTSTRWESTYSDPQWISVDLGAAYSVTGVKIIWQRSAGQDYKIQLIIQPGLTPIQ
jgi:hypothetical protein